MRAAELMLNEATNLFDKGLNPGEEANLSKLLSADAQWAAAEACIQTFGVLALLKNMILRENIEKQDCTKLHQYQLI